MTNIIPSSSKSDESRERLAEAIDLLIRDQDEKYDECLVDGLFKFIIRGDRIGFVAGQVIEDWYNDKEFTNAKHARLFKLQEHYYRFVNLLEKARKFDRMTSAKCFLSRLPAVISRGNASEISAALSLLRVMLLERSTYHLIIEKKINHHHVVDIASLAKYYLVFSNNYHIQNQAKKLFVELIKSTCRLPTPNQHRVVLSLKQSIDQLFESGSPAIYYVIFDCLSRPVAMREIFEKYEFKTLFRRHFNEAVDQNKRSEINNLCKCIAMSSIFSKTIIERLKATGNLEAIITYVTNLYESIFYHTTLRYLVVYPILFRCDSEDSQVLTSELMMNCDNRYFVERFMEDKFATQCILYLKESLSVQHHNTTAAIATRNQKRYLIYYLQVALEYIKSNHKSRKAYKNVLECCEILSQGITLMFMKSMMVWLFQLIDEICELVEKNDDAISGEDKAICLELIGLLARSQRKTTVFKPFHKFSVKIHKNYMRYITMAANFSDLDILNEFANLFNLCNFNFQQSPNDSRLYVELVWDHMYTRAKDNAFHDLYGSVVSLFSYIDYHCDAELLTDLKIQKHQTVPRRLGDILANFCTDNSTIEAIFKSLSNPCSNHPKIGGVNYLLTILKSTKSYSEELEHLIEGICIALRRELEEHECVLILGSIFSIVDELLKTNCNTKETLRRFVKTRILETLYYVHESSQSPSSLHISVCRKIQRLRSSLPQLFLFKSQQQASNSIMELVKELAPDDFARHERATQIAKFYLTQDRSCCPPTQPDCDYVDINSFVGTILDQKDRPRGILECY